MKHGRVAWRRRRALHTIDTSAGGLRTANTPENQYTCRGKQCVAKNWPTVLDVSAVAARGGGRSSWCGQVLPMEPRGERHSDGNRTDDRKRTGTSCGVASAA